MELANKMLSVLLEAALPVLVTAAAGWMVGKCVQLFKALKDKNPDFYYALRDSADMAVKAAEQIFGSDEGQKKKEYAMNVVEKFLASKGVKVDLDIIDSCIESSVKELKLEAANLEKAE